MESEILITKKELSQLFLKNDIKIADIRQQHNKIYFKIQYRTITPLVRILSNKGFEFDVTCRNNVFQVCLYRIDIKYSDDYNIKYDFK